MICRGIVEKIYDKNQVAVRVPTFDKSSNASGKTETSDLGVASICVLPNSIPNVRVGDIVYVGFENNDRYKPVIIGYVYIDRGYMTKQSLSLESLQVDVSTRLPEDTCIGGITQQEISFLQGARSLLQEQIDNLQESIDSIIDNGSTPSPATGGMSTGPIPSVERLDDSPTQDSPTFVMCGGQLFALVED